MNHPDNPLFYNWETGAEFLGEWNSLMDSAYPTLSSNQSKRLSRFGINVH